MAADGPQLVCCYVCGWNLAPELVQLLGHYMCRDRVDCYQRWRALLALTT